ncbi:MAG: hypothetical protein KBT01_09910 [Clostridiales bacterium]|nr:hypothetical protein [Candidatus Blautia equi]
MAEIAIQPSESWETFTAPLQIKSGKSPLYFTYTGEGYAYFMSFTLSKK